jgi:hypothetical protein
LTSQLKAERLLDRLEALAKSKSDVLVRSLHFKNAKHFEIGSLSDELIDRGEENR